MLIDQVNDNFSTICLCAMRYVLGRETYMPGLVQNYIKAHINEINSATIAIMIRDIDEADYIRTYRTASDTLYTVDGLGSTTIDRPGWERFREFLKGAIE